MTPKQMDGPAWAMMLALAGLWSLTFFAVEIGLRELGPFWLVAGRVAFGAVTLWALVLVTGQTVPRDLAGWRDLMVMGFLNNALPFSLIFWGQIYLTAGLTSIFNATPPIFAVLAAHLLLADERATPLKWLGVLFGLAGVAVMMGPEAFDGFSSSLLGQIAVIGAAISYTFAGIWGRRLSRFAPPVAAAGMLTCSTILMIPVAFLVEGVPPAALSLNTWIVILVLGVLASGLAYVLYFRILERAGATNLLLVTFLIPPGAILLGSAFLDEELTAQAFIGMALIFAGLVCVDGRLFRGRARA